jgi:hypothetical protein
MGSSETDTTHVKQQPWTTLPLNQDTSIQVSNGSVAIPEGFDVVPSFLTPEESQEVLEEFDKGDSSWEGFEQRRRVQRYSLNGNEPIPSSVMTLARRVIEKTGHSPQSISIEEYPRTQLLRHFSVSQSNVTTFESPVLCQCVGSKCSCFVAVVPICASVIENINRPKRRQADCWDLYSLDHGTGLVLERRSLYLKTRDFLWEWRSRICAAGPDAMPEEDRFVVVKLYSLPEASPDGGNITDSEFGYVPKPEDSLPRTAEMPPLDELLTIIVTTSPIKSNPSTELFERVWETFFHGGREFALNCRKVIVCDGCRQKNEKVSKRHTNPKQAMRNGIVDGAQYENYVAFKKALRQLCESATEESPFSNAVVEELDSRQGYGLALRHALRECVSTPYVIVIQHDRTFMRPTPILETVRTMWHHRKIKYVGMSMRSNLLYRDHFLGKYGKSYMDAMASCIVRPSELALDAELYGPNSRSTQLMEYGGSEKLRENIRALMETYSTSQQNVDHLEWIESRTSPPSQCQLSLTPTFFWYDNVHICETAHYRDFVFNPKFKMVVRGGFVEDKLSPVIKKTVERLGLVQGHSRFGCYLLDDHSGMFFTGHLDGGSYLTKEEKEALSSKRTMYRNKPS